MAVITRVILSGTTWRVPSDCTSATVHVIGGGYGGGGAYSRTDSVSLDAGSYVYIQIGSGFGGDTWFNKSANSAPTTTTDGAKAQGAASGGLGNLSTDSAVGGLAANGVGDLKYSGGGHGFGSGGDSVAWGGGGGAAGPNGDGGKGGRSYNSFAYLGGGGGGGANGGAAGSNGTTGFLGGAGGNNRLGSGGGTAGSGNGGAGSNGGGGGGAYSDYGLYTAGQNSQEAIWTDSATGISYGPGSGAGGITNFDGTTGLVASSGYGAGGPNGGRQGLIVVVYTQVAVPGTYTEVFTSAYNWIAPLGATTVTAEAIGAGYQGSASFGGTGGGGGAYAKTASVAVSSSAVAYIGFTAGSWFNTATNAAPGSVSTGVLAASSSSGTGGLAANSVGDGGSTFSGGNGGSNNASGTRVKGGGGGGSAGRSGAGKSGGNAHTSTGSGGGGGGGGSNAVSSTAGSNGAATTGGAGGAGSAGSGGGAGATSTAVAGVGSNGGGGGGGSASATSNRYYGAAGGMETVSDWTQNGINYGPGGGGGGGGATASVNGIGAAGGGYGGGGGGGTGGAGAGGIVVLTYTTTNPGNVTVDVTGVSGTGAVGSVTVSGGVTAFPSGVAASGAVGDVTVILGTPVVVDVTGVSGTGQVGDVEVNTYYWVGGSGNWGSDPNKWSYSSGGAGGAGFPTANDSVIFDANSSGGSYVVTILSDAEGLDVSVAPPATGTITWAGTRECEIYGSLTLPASGFVYTHTGTLTFPSTAASTITTNGNSLGIVTFNTASSTTLSGTFTATNITSTAASLSTAGSIFATTLAVSAGNVTANAVSLSGTSGTVLSTTASANLSGVGSIFLTATSSSGTRTIDALAGLGSTTVNVTNGSSVVSFTNNSIIGALNLTGFSGSVSYNTLSVFGTLTIPSAVTGFSGTLLNLSTATSAALTTNGVSIASSVAITEGGTVTLQNNTTVTGTVIITFGTLALGTYNLTCSLFVATTNVFFKRLSFGSGAFVTVNGTGAVWVDASSANNSLVYTGTTDLRFLVVAGAQTIALNNTTLEAIAPNISISGGSGTISLTGRMYNLDLTSFTSSVSNGTRTIYGSLTIGTSATFVSGTSITTFASSTTQTITSNGRQFTAATFSGLGTWVLQDAFYTVRACTLTQGTLNINSQGFEVGSFNSSGSAGRTVINAGDIYLNGINTTIWNTSNSTNLSFTGNTNIISRAGSAGVRTFSFGSWSPSNAKSLTALAGTDTVTFVGSAVSFFNLDIQASVAQTSNATYTCYGQCANFNTDSTSSSTDITLVLVSAGTVTPGNISGASVSLTGGGTFAIGDASRGSGVTVAAGTTANISGITGGAFVNNGILSATGAITVLSLTSNSGSTLSMGGGLWSLTGSGAVWVISSGASLTTGGSNISFLIPSTGGDEAQPRAASFSGGGKSYNKVSFDTVDFLADQGDITIIGDNTFTELSSTRVAAYNLIFTAGSTNTITTWTANGTAGNLIYLTSTTSSQFNLVKAGGGSVFTEYLNVNNSNVTPLDTWHCEASDGNVYGVNNTGWVVATVIVDVTGVFGTGQVGTVSVAVSIDAPVTGVFATGFVGTAIAQGGAGVNVIGVFGTGLVGNVNVTTQQIILVTGVFGTGQIGNVQILSWGNVPTNIINNWGNVDTTQVAPWTPVGTVGSPGWTDVNT